MPRSLTLFPLLTALLSLPPTTDSAAQEVRSRDSAGVRIFETSARKDAPVVFKLGEKPLLVVGGREPGQQEFNHQQGYLRGARLSNGGLAVIDVSRIHFFDAQGKRLRVIGREGEGRDEFRYLTSICVTRGDTIIVDDAHNKRLSILNGDGLVLRTILRENSSTSWNACLDDGTFVLEQLAGPMVAGQPGVYRLTRQRIDGTVVGVMGPFDVGTFDMVTQVIGSFSAFGSAVYSGDPFKGELREYDSSGRLRRLIRTADNGDSITRAEAEERMGMTIPNNVTTTERAARMERMRSRPHASHWPVLRSMQVGTDGTIWVQDFNKVPRSPDAWTAIDSAGRIVGRLEIPVSEGGYSGFQVISFGRDDVMLRRFDPDRLTSLVVVPLVRINR